jgi:putative transposase
MKQKRHTEDQIISKLRRADVLLGQDVKVPDVCKELEIAEQTYYRWRQKYGGMQPEMVKQLKALQKENGRLKKLVAEQALDMEILREAAKGN